MRQIVERYEETAFACVRDGLASLCNAALESERAVKLSQRLGTRNPHLHAGAFNKTLLAFASAADVDAVIAAGLPALTPTTITKPQVLHDELGLIRRRGYGMSEVESPWPIYSAIADRGLPIVRHPNTANALVANNAQVGRAVEMHAGWMYETTTAALSLMCSGALDAVPNLKVVLPHCGGVLPFITGRIDLVEPIFRPALGHRESIRTYLRRNFYADSVTRNPLALQMAAEAFGYDRLFFGSDTPYWGIQGRHRYC